MTQRNIDIMDRIVDELTNGKKLSEALNTVYEKRNVEIPFNDEMFDIKITDLHLSNRAVGALMRAGLTTVNKVIEYGNKRPLNNINNFGQISGIEFLEVVLDIAWDKMSQKEKVEFLIDTVERNQGNIRTELM
jgi:DNA-directed RNA polymerase alpha subunit